MAITPHKLSDEYFLVIPRGKALSTELCCFSTGLLRIRADGVCATSLLLPKNTLGAVKAKIWLSASVLTKYPRK